MQYYNEWVNESKLHRTESKFVTPSEGEGSWKEGRECVRCSHLVCLETSCSFKKHISVGKQALEFSADLHSLQEQNLSLQQQQPSSSRWELIITFLLWVLSCAIEKQDSPYFHQTSPEQKPKVQALDWGTKMQSTYRGTKAAIDAIDRYLPNA